MKNILLMILFSITPLFAYASDIVKTLANKYYSLKKDLKVFISLVTTV